ncbi:MAG: helix-turn-helix domain-containing protein [Gammaproteobacteria bacterium]|nr:helix-turn-helix domain-containing protein [Gammaproteobacteria bacterium]
MDQPEKSKSRDFVGSLARGLSVLRVFDSERPEMTLTQVAARTRMTRAGARRFLLTLVDLGYVKKNARLFRLTPKVLELGYAYMASTPISRLSQPHMKYITDLTGESCSIAVLDGEEVVYIARTQSNRFLRLGFHVGIRLPVSYTSAGRMLIASEGEESIDRYLQNVTLEARTRRSITSKSRLRAELLRTRKEGYAIVDQELEEGLASISVPIRGANNQVIATINTATNVALVPAEKLKAEFLPLLRKAAQDIEETLAT